jgi:hypothetical protein
MGRWSCRYNGEQIAFPRSIAVSRGARDPLTVDLLQMVLAYILSYDLEPQSPLFHDQPVLVVRNIGRSHTGFLPRNQEPWKSAL